LFGVLSSANEASLPPTVGFDTIRQDTAQFVPKILFMPKESEEIRSRPNTNGSNDQSNQ
jgi:hypothetical protein